MVSSTEYVVSCQFNSEMTVFSLSLSYGTLVLGSHEQSQLGEATCLPLERFALKQDRRSAFLAPEVSPPPPPPPPPTPPLLC